MMYQLTWLSIQPIVHLLYLLCKVHLSLSPR